MIIKANQRKRLAFAREHIYNSIMIWESVIWFDELKFELKNSKKRLLVPTIR